MAKKIDGALSKYKKTKAKAQKATKENDHYDDSEDIKPQKGRKVGIKKKIPSQKKVMSKSKKDKENEEYAKRVAQEEAMDKGTERALKRHRKNRVK